MKKRLHQAYGQNSMARIVDSESSDCSRSDFNYL